MEKSPAVVNKKNFVKTPFHVASMAVMLAQRTVIAYGNTRPVPGGKIFVECFPRTQEGITGVWTENLSMASRIDRSPKKIRFKCCYEGIDFQKKNKISSSSFWMVIATEENRSRKADTELRAQK